VKHGETLIVGLGEVGSALAEVVDRQRPALRHDLEPQSFREPIETMHVCIPFRALGEFESTVCSYIERFRPQLTIINSTVLPGTTRAIARRSKAATAYSPVRGKHVRMVEDMLRYVKFVAAPEARDAERAERHFKDLGLKTQRMSRPEALEIAKLAETTYFGVLIAFAQELNRFTREVGADYDEAINFFDEIEFLPRQRYFPGFIGGHCVIPNIDLLLKIRDSQILRAVLDSNAERANELNSAPAENAPSRGEANGEAPMMRSDPEEAIAEPRR
jgi:UDP-glucose 6-dehydrogenase